MKSSNIYERKSSGFIGSFRTRIPVAAKTALATAGASGGSPGSPTPPGVAVLFIICTYKKVNKIIL